MSVYKLIGDKKLTMQKKFHIYANERKLWKMKAACNWFDTTKKSKGSAK